MASKEINIEDLPSDILEEIFLFVPFRKDLRLVSKKFKEIVDNSTRLMAKYALKVSSTFYYKLPEAFVSPSYQALKCYYSKLNFDEFKWINFNKHRERINLVSVYPDFDTQEDDNANMLPIFIQSILLSFTSMHELHINLNNFEINDTISNFKLVSSDLSNLQKLTIINGGQGIEDVVSMFSELHSIKSVSFTWGSEIQFPKTAWKLEELNLYYIGSIMDEDYESCKKFLLSQKSSLRKFRQEEFGLCDFAMKNLPDIEVLHTAITSDKPFNNELMVVNDKLKSLTLCSFDCNNEELENILGSFSNLKYLVIKGCEHKEILGSVVGIELDNLTHLWLDGLLSSVLLNVKMPNLKFLEIFNGKDNDPYNFSRVPPENLKNLEKLSIANVWRIKELHHLLVMCPKLYHLNLGCFKEFIYFIPKSINVMLAHTHQLRYLGFLKENQIETREELQSQIHKKNIIVKIYDKFEMMMKDCWNIKCIEDTKMEILK